MRSETLAETTSLCPACLERVPGRYEDRSGTVYLARTCPEHGTTSRKVWGSRDHWEWAAETDPDYGADGDLTVAGDHACLAVVEVTQDCNLSCSFCFADSGPGGKQRSFEEVIELLEVVRSEGGTRPIQFSGGEPTVRDDLPELVERAGEMGFAHVQVNTNGIRLATEDGYADRLAAAGVSAVYLQFDGLTAETYEAIREVDLVAEKEGAIEACRDAGLPVVLVPTVVPGVNDDEMGDIVRFGLENADVVESINFQPVAQFGRYEATGSGRFPIDEAARRLATQLEGIEPRDLLPVPCCSSYCQLATALVPRESGAVALTRFLDSELLESASGAVDERDWMELLANTPAGRERACATAGCCEVEVPDGAGALLERVVPVSFTGFMDADAADADRLENCCIAVPTPDGDLAPFCGYNMTDEEGAYALRTREGWGGRPAVGEPAKEGTQTREPVEHGQTEGGER